MPRKKKKTITKQSTPAGALIYCGPDMPGAGLKRFTAFYGELPKKVNELLESNPKAAALFVAPGDLAKTRSKIYRKGTPEYQLYNKMKGGI